MDRFDLRHTLPRLGILTAATLALACLVPTLSLTSVGGVGGAMERVTFRAVGALEAQVPVVGWRSDPSADRDALARAYLRLELGLEEASGQGLLHRGEARREVNRGFDEVTLAFFMGDVTRALEGLGRLIEGVAEELGEGFERWDAAADSILDSLNGETRVFETDRRSLPYLLHLPDGDPPADGWPVVVALHGAGGDERMFFGGYGAGSIRPLASERGLAVIAPGNAASVDEVLELLEAVVHQARIDLSRVALLGHSMGAGIAGRAGESAPERFRAVACIAGSCGSTRPEVAPPPVWIGAGALDPISRAPVLEAQARAMNELGRDVTFVLLEDEGHTLIVGEVLPRVLDWLGNHLAVSPAR